MIFLSLQLKILNKFPDWKAIVIGDEKREKMTLIIKTRQF